MAPRRKWSLGIGGLYGSPDGGEAFINATAPDPQYLERALQADLGPGVWVKSPVPDPSLRLSHGKRDKATPHRYDLTVREDIDAGRLLAALVRAIESSPPIVRPGPMTVIIALYDADGNEVARRSGQIPPDAR